MAEIWQRLDHNGRLALPVISAVLCALLGSLVWPLPYLGSVAPPLALMTVYYWSVHRPDLFRPGMAFAVGLLADVVSGMPLGLSALLFVAAQQAVLRLRRFMIGHSFFMAWTGFILTAFAVLLTQVAVLSLIRWQGIPLVPVLMQFLMATAIFPLLYWLLIGLQRLTSHVEA